MADEPINPPLAPWYIALKTFRNAAISCESGTGTVVNGDPFRTNAMHADDLKRLGLARDVTADELVELRTFYAEPSEAPEAVEPAEGLRQPAAKRPARKGA